MKNLAHYIDHTLLKPEAKSHDIQKLCEEAINFSFYSVCVNSIWVPLAKDSLKNSPVQVCCVVGFPLGANLSTVKQYEAQAAVQSGASEIDMVISIGQLKEGNFSSVQKDIEAVVKAASNCIVKVIVETCLLTIDEKKIVSNIVVNSGAHYIKTSTGFNGPGADINDVKLFNELIGSKVKIKASGGIKSSEQAFQMIDAGASRLGTSSGVLLLQGQSPQGSY